MKLAENTPVIPWQIVNRNLTPGVTVRSKLTEKIAALSKLLVHFPPDSVHLQVVLGKLARKGIFDVRLTLRLPSHTLHAEKTGTDLLVTINTAIHALRREVMSHKAGLRGDYRWKRPARRARLNAAKDARLSLRPVAEMDLPADPDLTAQLFAANHAALLAHAGRVLRMAELTGDLPLQVVEAGDLVDEVARIVLDPHVTTRKPSHLSYQQWFFRLVQEEVDRQVQHFAEEMRLRADGGEPLIPATEWENGHDSEPLANLWRERMEPAEALLPGEQIADEETVPPDSAFAGQELVACLQQDVKSWPAIERQIFELHYLVGLEVDDIAQITRKLQIEVQGVIKRIEIRLRDFLRHAVSAP